MTLTKPLSQLKTWRELRQTAQEITRASSGSLVDSPGVEVGRPLQLPMTMGRFWRQQVELSLRVDVYSHWRLPRRVPTEELRIVGEELDIVMQKLDYESDDDAGFLPSSKTRRKHREYANAHTMAHALHRTNEALRALTNAVHVLHDIEKAKYVLEDHG